MVEKITSSKRKILVVDDSLTIQKVIRLALANEDYELQTVSEGKALHQQIALFRPEVVLLDMALNDRSAYEIREEFLNHPDFKSIRFIAMSSAFEKLDDAKLDQLQFHGRLIKPFDPGHLRETIQTVLATNKEFSSDLWEQSQASLKTKAVPPPVPVQAPPPKSNFLNSEDEIKKLTESTIRMSGWSDFGWSIDDSKIKTHAAESEPAIPPLLDDVFESDHAVKPPPPPVTQPPPMMQPPPMEKQIKAEEAPAIPLSTEKMEELLNKQFHDAIERMAREILPHIAEKIIKKEIHKLLADPPN